MIWPSLLIFAALSVSQAGDRPSDDMGNVNRWSIRDHHGSCSLFSTYEGDRFMRLEYDFGRNSAQFTVVDPAWRSVEENRTYQVRIQFTNGSDYPAGDAVGVRINGESGVLTGLNFHMAADEFLRDFAGAGAVGLFMGDTRLGAFALDGTRAAVTRLRSCALLSHRRYPPDPFARPAVPRQNGAPPAAPSYPSRARANLRGYFSTDDYPAGALRSNEQGTTSFQLTVDPFGRVSSCVITITSGSTALDQATCRILRSRARFTPARDSAGNPTTDTISAQITWTLPVEPAPLPPVSFAGNTDPNPSRVWIRIDSGGDRNVVTSGYAALRARARGLLSGRPLMIALRDASYHALLGPFPSALEAQELADRLRARGIPALVWTSRRGEPVERASP